MPQAKQCRRKPAVILTSLNSLWARARDNLESRLSKDILAYDLLKNIRLHYFPKQENNTAEHYECSTVASTLRFAQITAVMNVSLASLWRKNYTSNVNEGHTCVCAHMGRKAGDTDGVSLWKGLLRANTKVDSIRELISLIYRARYEIHRLGRERKNTEGWMESAQWGVESLCKKMAKKTICIVKNCIQMFLKEVTNAWGWIYLMKNIVISVILWNVIAI